MTFREDGEGLNDRAERLDHELQTAQKTLGEARERRLQHLEYELTDAQDRLNRMQQSLRQLRDEQAPSRPSPLAGLAKAMPVLLPVGMVAMLGFAIGHSSARKHHPLPPLAKKSAVTALLGGTVSAKMTGSASTKTADVGYGATEATVHVRWNAKVRRSTGLDMAPGTACRIEGDFASRGAFLRTANVEVWCGDKQVYEKGAYTGPSATVSVDEYTTDTGSFVYNLDVEDDHRPGYDKRATASIDTDARTAILARDIGDSFRLELDVEPVAAPTRASGPLFNTPRNASAAPSTRLARTARVVSTSGSAPIDRGQKCSVEIVPATPRSGWSCRTFIRCGDKAVYGEQRTGYGECSGPDDKLQVHDMGFTMEDGDPKLDVDLSKGTINLYEDDTHNWSVQLKID